MRLEGSFVMLTHEASVFCVKGRNCAMAIRLVVSDLDGTLLSSQHELTDEVKNVIMEYEKRGGLFTFATGRPLITAQTFERELNLALPYILCNGSIIAHKGEVVESSAYRVGNLAELLIQGNQAGIDVLLFHEEGISAFRDSETLRQFEHKERVQCSFYEPDASAWRELYVQKVILMGDLSVARALWRTHVLEYQYGDSYAAFQSEVNYWEIISGGLSKGTALQRLAKSLHIKPEEIMALGNQLNDLDMLRYAGIGVAVGNAHEELKAEASYVCSRGYGEGVIEAMEKFCL